MTIFTGPRPANQIQPIAIQYPVIYGLPPIVIFTWDSSESNFVHRHWNHSSVHLILIHLITI